jgi:hypothetical protein
MAKLLLPSGNIFDIEGVVDTKTLAMRLLSAEELKQGCTQPPAFQVLLDVTVEGGLHRGLVVFLDNNSKEMNLMCRSGFDGEEERQYRSEHGWNGDGSL